MSPPRRPGDDRRAGRPAAPSRGPRRRPEEGAARPPRNTGKDEPTADGKPGRAVRVRKDGSLASGRKVDREQLDTRPPRERPGGRPERTPGRGALRHGSPEGATSAPRGGRKDGAPEGRTGERETKFPAQRGRPEGTGKSFGRPARPSASDDAARPGRPLRHRDDARIGTRRDERPAFSRTPARGERDAPSPSDRPRARPERFAGKAPVRTAGPTPVAGASRAARLSTRDDARREERPAFGRAQARGERDTPSPSERLRARPERFAGKAPVRATGAVPATGDARPTRPSRPRPEGVPADSRDRAATARPTRKAADTARPGRAARVRKDGSVAVGSKAVRDQAAEDYHRKGEPQRIAKLLARAGIASRREIERMIEEGRIALDGKVIGTPATILTSLKGVTVDGQQVEAPSAARLFLFHKPTGYLTAERDPAGRPTIYDRLPQDLPRVMPVGRLDLNTEGLLLLTTDGELKRKLELPSSGIPRIYRARAYGEVSQDQLEALIEGVEIEGVRYGPIDANLERRTGANVWIEVKITEGKNREVRRVLEYLGLQVSRLIRVAYGPFLLGDMPIGEVGEVKQNDLVEFRKTLR